MISEPLLLALALLSAVSWHASGFRLFPKPGFGPPRLTGPICAALVFQNWIDPTVMTDAGMQKLRRRGGFYGFQFWLLDLTKGPDEDAEAQYIRMGALSCAVLSTALLLGLGVISIWARFAGH